MIDEFDDDDDVNTVNESTDFCIVIDSEGMLKTFLGPEIMPSEIPDTILAIMDMYGISEEEFYSQYDNRTLH